MNKAKQILFTQARSLKSKAFQKRRDADKLESEALELETQANSLTDYPNKMIQGSDEIKKRVWPR